MEAVTRQFFFGRWPSDRRFRATFGVSLSVATAIWELVLASYFTFELKISPMHLLWTLYFLKVYPTADVAAGRCVCDEKTFRKYVNYMLLVVLPLVLSPVGIFIGID